jgi:hypothetical protein
MEHMMAYLLAETGTKKKLKQTKKGCRDGKAWNARME